MVKSLILGSAAGLVAMSGAQAADLPVKAKAVEYVRICSLYGAGFYYIPGTDTCIKLGGYLRAEVGVQHDSVFNGNSLGVAGAAKTVLTNSYTCALREDLNIDTRTATEYGVVRTFFDAMFTWTIGHLRRARQRLARRLLRSWRQSVTPVNGRRYRWRLARRLLRLHPVRWLHDG